MTDTVYMIAHSSIAIFTSIAIVLSWATMSRWIIQVFERMVNVMDVGHFPDRYYD